MSWWICPFKFQPEAAAFARLGLNADTAFHAFGSLADEGQADAGAFVAPVELLEHAEDAFVIFLRDADAVVLEPDKDQIASQFRTDADARDLTGFDKLDGVDQ